MAEEQGYVSQFTAQQIEDLLNWVNNNKDKLVTNTVTNLLNYYLKTDLYTKLEVDELIRIASGLKFEKVNSLPSENIRSDTIYLVPSTNPKVDNVHDEWIYVNGQYESIGSTTIDLSGYVKTTSLKRTLESYLLKSDIPNKDDIHKHNNKNILDAFSEDSNGKLLYRNKPIESEGGSSSIDPSLLNNYYTKQEVLDLINNRFRIFERIFDEINNISDEDMMAIFDEINNIEV